MKRIRNLMTLAGLSLVLFALGVTGAKAQGFTTTSFSGTFTLPAETHWGKMTLPAGEYVLSYGQPFKGGVYAVAVTSKADGTTRMELVKGNTDTSARRDALVCIREGDVLLVRALDMPELGTAARFAMPRGMKLLAHRQKHGQYTLAEAPMLIERVPVTLNGK